MTLASDLLTLHLVEKEALFDAEKRGSAELIALFKGRVQGLERAMTLVGVEYIPYRLERRP